MLITQQNNKEITFSLRFLSLDASNRPSSQVVNAIHFSWLQRSSTKLCRGYKFTEFFLKLSYLWASVTNFILIRRHFFLAFWVLYGPWSAYCRLSLHFKSLRGLIGSWKSILHRSLVLNDMFSVLLSTYYDGCRFCMKLIIF